MKNTLTITVSSFKFSAAIVAVVTVIAMSSPARAQYSGYYGEGFFGSGTTQFNFFTDLSDFEGDSEFYGLTVGRVFNDNFAAEVTYVELGDSQATISDPVIATLDSDIESWAIAATAVGTYPFNRYFTVFGKFGFNQWSLDAAVTDNRFNSQVTLSAKDRGTGINYGVGMQYRFTPRYAIKLEYLIYQLNPELFSEDVAIGGATVALRFNY